MNVRTYVYPWREHQKACTEREQQFHWVHTHTRSTNRLVSQQTAARAQHWVHRSNPVNLLPLTYLPVSVSTDARAVRSVVVLADDAATRRRTMRATRSCSSDECWGLAGDVKVAEGIVANARCQQADLHTRLLATRAMLPPKPCRAPVAASQSAPTLHVTWCSIE